MFATLHPRSPDRLTLLLLFLLLLITLPQDLSTLVIFRRFLFVDPALWLVDCVKLHWEHLCHAGPHENDVFHGGCC